MKSKYESLAIANVVWQQFDKTYEPDKALKVGTIFPELDKPFWGKRGSVEMKMGGEKKWIN